MARPRATTPHRLRLATPTHCLSLQVHVPGRSAHGGSPPTERSTAASTDHPVRQHGIASVRRPDRAPVRRFESGLIWERAVQDMRRHGTLPAPMPGRSCRPGAAGPAGRPRQVARLPAESPQRAGPGDTEIVTSATSPLHMRVVYFSRPAHASGARLGFRTPRVVWSERRGGWPPRRPFHGGIKAREVDLRPGPCAFGSHPPGGHACPHRQPQRPTTSPTPTT